MSTAKTHNEKKGLKLKRTMDLNNGWPEPIEVKAHAEQIERVKSFEYVGTVEPLIYDPPHERPPAIYDHISCSGW